MQNNSFKPLTWWWKYESLLEKSFSQFPYREKVLPSPLEIFPDIIYNMPDWNWEISSHRFEDDGERYSGLKHLQRRIDKYGRPIYLVDNHDYALYAFYELFYFYQHRLECIHIDAHRDDAIFFHEVPRFSAMKEIQNILTKTKVSNYLDVAQKGGLISLPWISLTQSFEFKSFLDKTVIDSQNKKVLNLDIDIFGAEGEVVSLEMIIGAIAKAASISDAIIIATSPGFIDQSFARSLIECLTNLWMD